MKIAKKILIILIISFIIFSIYLVSPSYATSMINGDDWNNVVSDTLNTTVPSTSLTRFIVTVVRVCEVAFTGFCVICTSVIGIRYFTTASASTKYKERGSLYWALIIIALGLGFDAIVEVIMNAVTS